MGVMGVLLIKMKCKGESVFNRGGKGEGGMRRVAGRRRRKSVKKIESDRQCAHKKKRRK